MINLYKNRKIWKFLWLKKYFDIGLGLTNYFKYLIALFGLYSIGKDIDINITIYVGVGYVIFCFFLGAFWVKTKAVDIEKEIDNILDPFQREVRRKLSRKRFK